MKIKVVLTQSWAIGLVHLTATACQWDAVAAFEHSIKNTIKIHL